MGIVGRVGIVDLRVVGVCLGEAVAGGMVISPSGRVPCRAVAGGRERRTATSRVIGVANGIGRPPFSKDVAERIVRLEHGVAERVGR